MFTGIIEQTGQIKEIQISGSNKIFWVQSPFSEELKIDQSVSHDGVCLTVDAIENGLHRVTAINETLQKTNLNHWQTGSIINLERCLPMNGRIDGHIVQGHVDTTATCKIIAEKNGSWELTFEFDPSFAALIIEKGSIAINGVSLTLYNVSNNAFNVSIIPYTYNHTNISKLIIEDKVNIEFDMIGKYVNRFQMINKEK